MHRTLRKLQIEESLIQLLLPSDQFFHTNHSTKFAEYIKYHSARILIYIGLGDRVGNRVNVFTARDQTEETATSQNKKVTVQNLQVYGSSIQFKFHWV